MCVDILFALNEVVELDSPTKPFFQIEFYFERNNFRTSTCEHIMK